MNAQELMKLSCEINALIGYARSADCIVDGCSKESLQRWADGLLDRAEAAEKNLDKMIELVCPKHPSQMENE